MNNRIIALAETMNMDAETLEREMRSIGQFIADKFIANDIEVTQENVAKAIPLALQAMISMGERYLNDPEYRLDMLNKIYDSIKPEADKRAQQGES